MRILVMGDTMIDVYFHGVVERISPECSTAVVLDFVKEERFLGGAANVAANIRTITNSFGSKRPEIDYFGFYDKEVLELAKPYNLRVYGSYLNSGPVDDGKIMTKTRFVSSEGSQILRVDNFKRYGSQHPYINNYDKIFDFNQFDLLVISDYDKGTLEAPLWRAAAFTNIPKVIDLKRNRFAVPERFGKNTVIKCNMKEYEENGIKELIKNPSNGVSFFVVTAGPDGYYTLDRTENGLNRNNWESWDAPDMESPVQKTVGAGDVFLSGMASQFIFSDGKFKPYKMASFGNYCASRHVRSDKQTVSFFERKDDAK